MADGKKHILYEFDINKSEFTSSKNPVKKKIFKLFNKDKNKWLEIKKKIPRNILLKKLKEKYTGLDLTGIDFSVKHGKKIFTNWDLNELILFEPTKIKMKVKKIY